VDLGYLSRIRIFHPGSRVKRIPDPGSTLKNFLPQKLFLSSRKCDPGCSSRIRTPDPDLDFFTHPGSRIQGAKKTPDPDPRQCLVLVPYCGTHKILLFFSQVARAEGLVLDIYIEEEEAKDKTGADKKVTAKRQGSLPDTSSFCPL
jgi:hypothetical protein